jgi:hypothetical protein
VSFYSRGTRRRSYAWQRKKSEHWFFGAAQASDLCRRLATDGAHHTIFSTNATAVSREFARKPVSLALVRDEMNSELTVREQCLARNGSLFKHPQGTTQMLGPTSTTAMIAIAFAGVLTAVPLPAWPQGTPEFSTTKVCQLTGEEDREHPGTPTGSQLGGATGGLRGTDLGVPFEHDGKLYLLFGDTIGYDPDLCEPAFCGTRERPQLPREGNPRRWPSEDQWRAWLEKGRDGADSMATAPLNFDPDHCIPITVQSDDGRVFAHDITGNTSASRFS